MVRLLGGREVLEAHAVAGELRGLAAAERRLGLHRPRLRACDADRDDQDAEVDDESAVAAGVGGGGPPPPPPGGVGPPPPPPPRPPPTGPPPPGRPHRGR